MITNNIQKGIAGLLTLLLISTAPLLQSCSDFFDQESDNVIYSTEDHLTNWPDSVYSVMGILNKLQYVGDRTVLLGELRGDLVTLTSDASADLREIATFSVDDNNIYNQPRDYYAIINNCNYYIANANASLKSNRNEYIFMRELAVVKAIRAWTYLQLVLNYGSVPFYTEPLLTEEESRSDFPRYDLAKVCQYFIDDLSTIPATYDNEYPWYGNDLRGIHSRFFFFPLNIVRGDLYLWLASTQGAAGQTNYRNAAVCYYKYINERNAQTSSPYYAVAQNFVMWFPGTTSWTDNDLLSYPGSFANVYADEEFSAQAELITLIAGDSLRSEANYCQLPNLFNSTTYNNYKYSITPSKRMVEISEAQVNCCLASNGKDSVYVPSGMADHTSGDLRLQAVWSEGHAYNLTTGTREEIQTIKKYDNLSGQPFNVHIYRRQMIYLRMAEALNMAGYPRVAYKILERGLTDKVIKDEVLHYLNNEDSTWVADNLKFDDNNYKVIESDNMALNNGQLNLDGSLNTIGIHSRGSGWTPKNAFYRLVADSVETDATKYDLNKAQQQAQVDSLLLNEGALECCFEGTRYYDLMRFAMRQKNPGAFMQKHVNARNGQASSATIMTDLTDTRNWYLKWGGKIGF